MSKSTFGANNNCVTRVITQISSDNKVAQNNSYNCADIVIIKKTAIALINTFTKDSGDNCPEIMMTKNIRDNMVPAELLNPPAGPNLWGQKPFHRRPHFNKKSE